MRTINVINHLSTASSLCTPCSNNGNSLYPASVFVVGKRRPFIWEVGAEETLITLICANSGSVTGGRGQPWQLVQLVAARPRSTSPKPRRFQSYYTTPTTPVLRWLCQWLVGRFNPPFHVGKYDAKRAVTRRWWKVNKTASSLTMRMTNWAIHFGIFGKIPKVWQIKKIFCQPFFSDKRYLERQNK